MTTPPVPTDSSHHVGVWDLVERDLPPLRLEEFERRGQYVVRVETPGVDPERDVDITVEDHMLRVDVRRREETSSEERGVVRSEFRYGSFVRVTRLPKRANGRDITAVIRNGILEVSMPITDPEPGTIHVPVLAEPAG
jgi:HSP20 family protein